MELPPPPRKMFSSIRKSGKRKGGSIFPYSWSFFATVKLLGLQSLKAVSRRTFRLSAKAKNVSEKAPVASKKAKLSTVS